jgi:hypothetical protein
LHQFAKIKNNKKKGTEMKIEITKEAPLRIVQPALAKFGTYGIKVEEYGMFLFSLAETLSPHAWAESQQFDNGDYSGCVRNILERAIEQVENFDRESVLTELRYALKHADEITAALTSK